MIKVNDVFKIINDFAPLDLQMSFDNSGFLIGNADMVVNKIMLCTDVTPSVVDEAVENNCNLIISHHPVIFKGIKNICSANDKMKFCVLTKLLSNSIACIAVHTNLDICKGGTNDYLAQKLGVQNLAVEGEPLRIGNIQNSCTLEQFAKKVKTVLSDDTVRYVGNPQKIIKNVAVSTGAGGRDSELIYRLQNLKTDVLVTAELAHNVALDAMFAGVAVVEVSHYASERCVVDIIGDLLDKYNIDYQKSVSEGSPYHMA